MAASRGRRTNLDLGPLRMSASTFCGRSDRRRSESRLPALFDQCCRAHERPKWGSQQPCGGAEAWPWRRWFIGFHDAEPKGGTSRSRLTPRAPALSPFLPLVTAPGSRCPLRSARRGGLAAARRRSSGGSSKAVGHGGRSLVGADLDAPTKSGRSWWPLLLAKSAVFCRWQTAPRNPKIAWSISSPVIRNPAPPRCDGPLSGRPDRPAAFLLARTHPSRTKRPHVGLHNSLGAEKVPIFLACDVVRLHQAGAGEDIRSADYSY